MPYKYKFNKINFYFEPRDLWIGVYWNKEKRMPWEKQIYICLLPTLVIKLSWLPEEFFI